jgi:tetratricopeptide (TPR) repeat protein
MTGTSVPLQQFLQSALLAHRKGDVSEAERLYSKLIEHDPGNFDALHLLGVIRAQQKRFVEADRMIAKALEFGSSVAALSNHGGVLVELERMDEAIPRLRRALAMKPDYAEAHYNLGNALRKSGQLEEAVRSYEMAIKHRPNYVDAYLNASQALLEHDRQAEAIATLRRAIGVIPNSARLHNNLGVLLRKTGDVEGSRLAFERTVTQLRRALQNRPVDAELLFNLGNALMKCDRTEEAAQALADAVRIKPDFADALENIAGPLRELGRHAEAAAALQRAIGLRPRDARLHNLLGVTLQEAGKLDAAAAALQQALTLDPSMPEAFLHLTRLAKVSPADEIVTKMEALAHGPATLPPEARAMLCFALGKAYDDMGRFDDAFAKFLEGNRLARPAVAYDEAAWSRRFQHMQHGITPLLMADKPGRGCQSDLPIFVLGFPRSGTTLSEQILASHPMVKGAGERTYIPELTSSEILDGGDGTRFPESLAGLEPDAFRRLGEVYIDRLQRVAPTARRITDKLPENFLFLGFIHLILPRARVIHVMRDPLDTCFSCFTQRFNRDSAAFSYDLDELGRHYRMYLGIMDHWRRVLPPGSMLEVRYESIVEDLEAQARRIVDYCDLPWDDRCLSFHETERTVRTASVAQVRQPIFRSGLQRWRRYEKHLGPLISALGESVARPG